MRGVSVHPLPRRVFGLAAVLCLLVGATESSSAASLTTGKVKKIVKRQIKKRVPGMIDAATLDQGTIPAVSASITDSNKTLFTTGPFTVSLDCSPGVNLKLLVRTTEENSVVNDGSTTIVGDLDPADGDQPFANYTGNPPGGDAETDYTYYQVATFRSPDGTHVYAQFDTVTNYQGAHCFADGWFLDLAGDTGGKVVGPAGAIASLAPVTTGKVKRIAKKQINKLVPRMIDEATLDQGTVAPTTAAVGDLNTPVFFAGPFTVTMDCSLDGPNVELELKVQTTEENSVVNDNAGLAGDLDPADGPRTLISYLGNPPGGDAGTDGLYYEFASLKSPSGTHVFLQLDSVTNHQGNNCYVDGWFFDLAGKAETGSRTAAPASTLAAPVTTGKVKRIAKKLIKKLVPKMIDAATVGQGRVPPIGASISDPTKTVLTPGPFTISLDCSNDGGDVGLALLVRTTEENSVEADGYGGPQGDLDPIDGDQIFEEYPGNPPGGDAYNLQGIGYDQASFRSPSGTHVWVQFDTMTNLQGNHCFTDGWFLDLAG